MPDFSLSHNESEKEYKNKIVIFDKKLNYCLWIPLFCAFSTFAQPSPGKDITGTIINERGEPLANANVSIKNGRGTVTNARGQFLLKNVTANDILQISFVGYSNLAVAVKDRPRQNAGLPGRSGCY